MRSGHTIQCVLLLASIQTNGSCVSTSIRDDIPSAPAVPARHGVVFGSKPAVSERLPPLSRPYGRYGWGRRSAFSCVAKKSRDAEKSSIPIFVG
jgi:hypothetical protein